MTPAWLATIYTNKNRLSIYETRLRDTLGLIKNLKRDHWQAIDCGLVMRERHGKPSVVYHNDRILSNAKVLKERGRYRLAASDHQGQGKGLLSGVLDRLANGSIRTNASTSECHDTHAKPCLATSQPSRCCPRHEPRTLVVATT
jgi:hypothetical protein